MDVRVYYGASLASYGFGNNHPFGPDRLDAFWREFTRRGLDRRCDIAAPATCTDDDLARFHTRDYLARVKRQSQTGEGYLDYGDTPAFPGVYQAASTVVGSVLDALRAILGGECTRAFVPIAGLHHARRDSAAGFCVFNDQGVAIETLRAVHGIQRIAYVDIDAHHGDGVFYAFEDDPNLIYADIHEDGRYLYPGTGSASETGRGKAAGTKLNIPLSPESGDKAFFAAWERVEAFVREARPEFILLQAGADSLDGDPITHLRYTPAAHTHAARRLRVLADELCQGRLLATGGGGYNRANLASAWCAVVEGLLDA
ncbi:MAG: acetoin utilization protein AcuC [Gammaproteobacteria bacterium]|nr:MAG: acetoin utilization protein AcuC [Gammaproteobacteria bacterium]